jgi:dTDP-4-dehydrorhamnose reductase
MAGSALITGGAGRLAQALVKIMPGIVAVPRSRLDVTDAGECLAMFRGQRSALMEELFRNERPETIIHTASLLSVDSEQNPRLAWAVNVEGTRNVVRAGASVGARVVFISSEYVFGGQWSSYSEGSATNPIIVYGRQKVAAERIVLEVPHNLVIRAAFRHDPPWPYPGAFIDYWTSALWLSDIAPDIARAALSDLTEVLHIGGPRRCLYDMVRERCPEVKPISRDSWTQFPIPRDTSLDCTRWNEWKAAHPVAV